MCAWLTVAGTLAVARCIHRAFWRHVLYTNLCVPYLPVCADVKSCVVSSLINRDLWCIMYSVRLHSFSWWIKYWLIYISIIRKHIIKIWASFELLIWVHLQSYSLFLICAHSLYSELVLLIVSISCTHYSTMLDARCSQVLQRIQTVAALIDSTDSLCGVGNTINAILSSNWETSASPHSLPLYLSRSPILASLSISPSVFKQYTYQPLTFHIFDVLWH